MNCRCRPFAFAMIVLLAVPAIAVDKGDGWISLFDGKTLKGWRVYNNKLEADKGWVVEDGALFLKHPGRWPDGYTIITEQQYDHFELELEWKVSPGANSGIIYRAREGDRAPYISGPEYQILDDEKLGRNPKHSAAALYDVYAAEGKQLKPTGQYNHARIIARGPKVEHWLNGKKVVEYDMTSGDWKQAISSSKFKNVTQFAASMKGHICLQDHNHQVWYRNIRLRPLAAEVEIGAAGALFEETFSGELAEGWTWYRQKEGGWRIKDGALELKIDGRSATNVPAYPVPDPSKGPYIVDVTLTSLSEPTQQYEQAGFTWITDGKQKFKFVKERIDGELYMFPGKKPMAAATVQMRLEVRGDKFTALYRPDAKDQWLTAFEGKIPAGQVHQVGVMCFHSPPDAEHWIRFDDFRIVKLSD